MLRALIVDDEPPARKRLQKLLRPLEKSGRVRLVGEASDGFEALEHLEAEAVDLVLLDIQMPEMSGFDLLERLPPDKRPIVVFTTAYDTYALRAFEANAIDYLLKPIPEQRLEQAITRAERMLRKPETRVLNEERFARLLDWLDTQAMEPLASGSPETHDYIRQISVPYRGRILVIPVSDVIAVEINEGVTRITTLSEKSAATSRLNRYIVTYTLDELETHLDPRDFLRIHRSVIIRLDQIREMIPWFSGRYKLILAGGHEVIASRERSRVLKQKLLL